MGRLSSTAAVVEGEMLLYVCDGREVTIPVGSSAWRDWLEQATTFAFRSYAGNFTAHKTRASNGRGGWYWYAYRRRRGHLVNLYLGVSEKLTLDHLIASACQLSKRLDEHAGGRSDVPITLLPGDMLSINEDALLMTRLSVPRLSAQHISRSRLLTLMDKAVRGALTLVAAPAGSGKTTLLAEWARHTNIPLSWLSLEAADNDPTHFFSYLLVALSSLDEQLRPILSIDWTARSWEQVMTRLINELGRRLHHDVVLILDDAHLLTSEAIRALLRFLLDHLPPQLHLVIGTRGDLPLPLTRLRAHNQLGELRSDELRFASDELAAFVQAMEMTLPIETVKLLEERTEGWIAGVQLLALALRGGSEVASLLHTSGRLHPFVHDYVCDEVLRHQDPQLQTFLLQTSLLDRLCASLCEYVVGQPAAQARFLELQRANLFLNALDDTQTWFSYHPLFAESLRISLANSQPALIPALYRRASLWHEQRQELALACDYALRAYDYERAAHLLTTMVRFPIQAGRGARMTYWSERLGNWLDQLPIELIAASAPLCFATIMIQVQRGGSPEQTRHLLEHMRRHVQTRPPQAAAVELQAEFALLQGIIMYSRQDRSRTIALFRETQTLLSGQETAWSRVISLRLVLLIGVAHRTNGDLKLAEQALREAALPREGSSYTAQNLIVSWSLSELFRAQGRLREQEQLAHALFQFPDPAFYHPTLPLALMQMSRAALLYERNHLSEAASVTDEALAIAEQMDLGSIALLCYWIQIRIHLARGEGEPSRPFHQRVGARIPIVEREIASRRALEVRLALAQGRIEVEEVWERSLEESSISVAALEGTRYFDFTTLVRVQLARARILGERAALVQAARLLDQLRGPILKIGLNGWYIEVQMLTALVLNAQGRRKQALDTLESILEQAEREGYLRLFADEGAPMASLLTQLSYSTKKCSAEYLQRCLSAIVPSSQPEIPSPPAVQGPMLLDPLSPRELEVLGLIAAGLSNQQIAQRLVISLHTVKVHVKHLLAKLAVANRTQAVGRARNLGLL